MTFMDDLLADRSFQEMADASRDLGRLYIVGGFVRDSLVGITTTDIDLAFNGEVEVLAERLASIKNGHFFFIHERHQLIRVEYGRDSHISTIDIAPLEGTIEQDLNRRDFTVNAMAIDPVSSIETGQIQIIDPTNGRRDLSDRVLCLVDNNALSDDPVRIIRGLRFVLRYGLTMPESTRQAVMTAARLLAGAPGERLFDELSLLAGSVGFSSALELMLSAKVLGVLLPECQDIVGVSQNRFHHLDVWQHTLESINIVEKFLTEPGAVWPRHGAWLKDRMDRKVQGRCTIAAAIKLGLLFHDIGKAKTMEVGHDGAIHFYGHAKYGTELLPGIARRLKMSKSMSSLLSMIIREHMRPGFYQRDDVEPDHAVTRLVKAAGEWLPELIIIAYADRLAASGPMSSDESSQAHMEYLGCLLDEYVCVETTPPRRPLLSGDDIMKELGITPGPLIGDILEAIENAQDAGKISTREEALQLAKRLMSSP